jgi:predicted aminopeptidase
MSLKPRKIRFFLPSLLLAALAVLSLSSCADVGYYARATQGHLDILRARQPIDSLLCSDDTTPEMKKSLAKVMEIRDFATRELKLPENGSYRCYSDIKRPYVVWNVVATREFEMKPVQWCFPVAGCVNYRGFHSKEEAKAFADGLRGRGYDVYLYGVSAYSTLGWFDDPVLNTFLDRPEPDLAGLIFHELAHQKVYVKNDSAFNEGFAKTVELEGVTRFLERHGGEKAVEEYMEDRKREEEWVDLIAKVQQKLKALYSGIMGEKEKRSGKDEIFNEMREDYVRLKESWGGYAGYDRWFAKDLNNAKLASVDTYRSFVPAFRRMLETSNGDLSAFYRETRKLGTLPGDKRVARLETLRSEYIAEQERRKAPEVPAPAVEPAKEETTNLVDSSAPAQEPFSPEEG